MKKEMNTEKAPQAIGPYAQGIETQGLVFISGQLPINAETGEMPETILDQTHQSLKNIGFILKAAGLTMNDIVKTTIFVQDISDFNVVNEVYGTYFDTPYPSRSTIEVARLPKDAKVEIEAIAVKQ